MLSHLKGVLQKMLTFEIKVKFPMHLTRFSVTISMTVQSPDITDYLRGKKQKRGPKSVKSKKCR